MRNPPPALAARVGVVPVQVHTPVLTLASVSMLAPVLAPVLALVLAPTLAPVLAPAPAAGQVLLGVHMARTTILTTNTTKWTLLQRGGSGIFQETHKE